MQKLIITILLMFFILPGLIAQDIKHRISESEKKQKNIEHTQGGVLLRFDHEKLKKVGLDNNNETAWQCKELWIAKNVMGNRVEKYLESSITNKKDKVKDVVANYNSTVKIDTIASIKHKDIVLKLMELEKRIIKLEKKP